MAWNKYYIVVTNRPNEVPDDLLKKLELTGYIKVGQADFHDTNKSNDLFIGSYGDNLVIANPDLTYAFFAIQPTQIEKKFIEIFPDSEIAALAENSSVGEFGYAIIENNARVRIKHGCDGNIYNELGDLLYEEEEILEGDIFEQEELDEMREDMNEEDVQKMIAFEASWRTPAQISKRYFADRIDNLDSDSIKMTRYKKM